MLTHHDLRKGVKFIFENEPYEVLEFFPIKKAQGRAIVQTKIKNLITGNVIEKNFHQGDVFKEAEVEKIKAKFLYSHRDKYVFCEESNPKNRFELTKEQIGESAKFLKPNQIVEGIVFEGKIININLPIKVQLKVVQSPPGIKGDRAQGGVKTVILETGAEINVPLFINENDIIEINTETGEYVKRVDINK
mgnify:FL=1